MAVGARGENVGNDRDVGLYGLFRVDGVNACGCVSHVHGLIDRLDVFVTGGMFGVMSLYGMTTQRDLTGMGSFMMMGLVGLILASLVNIFFRNEMVYWITTYVGIIILSD